MGIQRVVFIHPIVPRLSLLSCLASFEPPVLSLATLFNDARFLAPNIVILGSNLGTTSQRTPTAPPEPSTKDYAQTRLFIFCRTKMRVTPTVLQVAACLSSLAPLASAWPGWLPDKDSLVARQNDDEDSTSAAETGARSTATEAAETGSEDDDSEPTETDGGGDLNTAKPTSKGGKDAEETGTPTSERKTKSIPADAAVGGVNMMTPDTTAVATILYKIGDYVTLGWNYTGIQSEPTAVDVLLSCSAARETWTLTSNMTWESDVAYIWDTNEQAEDVENPLGTNMYTLIVKDVDAEITEFPSAGKLGADASFKFGMYHKQAYVPWDEWECNGCDKKAAAPGMEQSLKLALTMCTLTVVTLTGFASGWGL